MDYEARENDAAASPNDDNSDYDDVVSIPNELQDALGLGA